MKVTAISGCEYRVEGRLTESGTGRSLTEHVIYVTDVDCESKDDPLRVIRTNAKGEFFATFNQSDFVKSDEDSLREGAPDLLLRIFNRFGEALGEAGPFVDVSPCMKFDIAIETKPERPVTPPQLDPSELKDLYPESLERLEEHGIRGRGALFGAELETFAQGSELRELEALRLHVDVGPAMEKDFALALVNAGLKDRATLAGQQPTALVKAVKRAEQEQLIPTRERLSGSALYGLIAYAKGFDPKPFSSDMAIKKVLTESRPLFDAVKERSPLATLVDVRGLINPFARLNAVSRMRAILDAAGVSDLSALGRFEVRGRRVITPGTYVARPTDSFAFGHLLGALRLRGAGYRKVKQFNILSDVVHIEPNPVREAIIIGSLVDFIEDGQLVIGREVTSLTIITEEILYSQLNLITWEDRDVAPPVTAAISPRRAALGTPRNDRNVYSPGPGNTGRNGGPGSNGEAGDAGLDGDRVSAAPALEIFVQRTPQGLPDISVRGRPGGAGQPGQHGGNGSDGARGRGAESGLCQCWRPVGRGGNGGPGGTGGTGGPGGGGGSAGSVTIHTLEENIAPLTTTRALSLDLSGGPGGTPGSGGLGGEGGRGGSPGDDANPWCNQDPSQVGTDGPLGADGPRGETGAEGAAGTFTLQPLTLSDWNAAANLPWISRVEPAEGVPGTEFQIVARNITDETRIIIGGPAEEPLSRDVERGTLTARIREDSEGGQFAVQLWMPTSDGTPLFSNTAHFRVLPRLDRLTVTVGVPGTTIGLRGVGFADGAQVRFGERTFELSGEGPFSRAFTLPDHEGIGMTAGAKEVQVVNPDGRASNPLEFELELVVNVRIKAWRVFPEFILSGGGGFGGDPFAIEGHAENIRSIFETTGSPRDVFLPHSISLVFEDEVGRAILPADVGSSFPRGLGRAEQAALLKATDDEGNFLHFDPGAINFYFVEQIDDYSTHAFTWFGSETERSDFVVFQDNVHLLSLWELAHVAAHEVGHVFGLPHVCDDNPAGTTFGRTCSEGSDSRFLMYPSTNIIIYEDNVITELEARTARRTARLWHNL